MTIVWTFGGIEYVSLTNFARHCGVANTTVHYWCRKGLPYKMNDRIYMIEWEKGLKWVKAHAPRVSLED